METLGWLNGYQIQYLLFRPGTGWAEALPTRNWMLFVTVGEHDRAVFDELTTECMQRQPLGICCAGPGAALLEDWFDEEIVIQAVEWEEQHQQQFDYKYAPVTTAHADIADGFWFATLNSPNLCAAAVERIICVDAAASHHARLAELLHLISTGWMPPNETPDD